MTEYYSIPPQSKFDPKEFYMDIVPWGKWPMTREMYDTAIAEVGTAVRAFIPKEYWYKIHWGVVPYQVDATDGAIGGTVPAVRWKYDPRGF